MQIIPVFSIIRYNIYKLELFPENSLMGLMYKMKMGIN